MTPEEFEQWLIDQEYKQMGDSQLTLCEQEKYWSVSVTYRDVLAKFRAVLPPPTTLN
jgi:hypothetical protein